MARGLFDLSGKVAIVTGAGRGLGKSIAVGLAQHGADVVVVSRTLAQCEQTAGEIIALGRRALALQVDTSRTSDVDTMVARTVERLGRLDVLVNNAGIDIIKPALDYTKPSGTRSSTSISRAASCAPRPPAA
jgi:NAD(P)-dependent dehydrogenase (short-subunit alcohol dehydrogenase family)